MISASGEDVLRPMMRMTGLEVPLDLHGEQGQEESHTDIRQSPNQEALRGAPL